MQSLILLSVLGCSFAAPFLQDTPEVVAEKARFNQLWQAQAAAAAAAPDPVPATVTAHVHHAQPTHTAHVHHVQPTHTALFTPRWTGPVAATIPAGVPGSVSQVPDTADVAAERSRFLAAFRAQVAATTGQQFAAPAVAVPASVPAPAPVQMAAIPEIPAKWMGPLAATIPAGVNGQLIQVADTADVAAARDAFLASYNAALAATQPAALSTQFTPSVASEPAVHPRWNGPFAATVPAGVPGSVSQVSDTADVAAATAAFQQAYNAALSATTGQRF